MTREDAKDIVENMLRRSKDIECPDYQFLTKPQCVALQVLIGRKRIEEEDY